jgi:type II secretory pathway pseudopilin PulG
VTLVELMVVVAIVGLMAGLAVVSLNPDKHARTARGFADEIGGVIETARDRAISTHAYQRIRIEDGTVYSGQAPVRGFAGRPTDPDLWQYIGALPPPSAHVAIVSFDPVAHIDPGDALPAEGAGLPADIDIAPDGTASPGTIFVADQSRQAKARVVVVRATGAVLVLDSW